MAVEKQGAWVAQLGYAQLKTLIPDYTLLNIYRAVNALSHFNQCNVGKVRFRSQVKSVALYFWNSPLSLDGSVHLE